MYLGIKYLRLTTFNTGGGGPFPPPIQFLYWDNWNQNNWNNLISNWETYSVIP